MGVAIKKPLFPRTSKNLFFADSSKNYKGLSVTPRQPKNKMVAMEIKTKQNLPFWVLIFNHICHVQLWAEWQEHGVRGARGPYIHIIFSTLKNSEKLLKKCNYFYWFVRKIIYEFLAGPVMETKGLLNLMRRSAVNFLFWSISYNKGGKKKTHQPLFEILNCYNINVAELMSK